MQFAIFGPADHIEVEEMRRMVQSFGGVFDETFSAESLRFVLVRKQKLLDWAVYGLSVPVDFVVV